MSSKGTSIEQKPKHVVKRLLHQHMYIPTEPVLNEKVLKLLEIYHKTEEPNNLCNYNAGCIASIAFSESCH